MVKAYKKYWQKMIQFDGYSSRSDYWWVFLVNSIILLILLTVRFFMVIPKLVSLSTSATGTQLSETAQQMNQHPTGNLLVLAAIMALFGLIILIPNTALSARRLRDAGFVWWIAILFGLAALINLIVAMVHVSLPFGLGWLLDLILFVTYLLCLFPARYRENEEDDSHNYD